MAVEAHHHHHHHHHRHSPAQLIGNREGIFIEKDNEISINMGFGIPVSLAGALQLNPGDTNLLTFHNSDLIPAMNTATFRDRESGLTCNNNSNLSVSRKRGRDFNNSFSAGILQQKDLLLTPGFSNDLLSFLGDDFSVYIHQQQLEIDRFIALHTEKVRAELLDKRRRHSRRLLAALEEGMVKRLKAKEEEIEKIGKMNWVLEERVRSLCTENQIWQNLAKSNEATANALRNDLEQVLAQVKENGHGEIAEDAQSCCNSNKDDGEKNQELKEVDNINKILDIESSCRNCWKNSSCVLLLPCRHLCLCSLCSSRLHTCPICKSIKKASVHINLS